MLPKSWRPTITTDLVRIGPKNDGGYVIPKVCVDQAEFLVSFGLFDNWDFEADFRATSKCQVTCYDHTVTSEFWVKRFAVDMAATLAGKRRTRKQIQDIGKFVGYREFFGQDGVRHERRAIGYPAAGMVSVTQALEETRGRPTFIKMDIEGWEYRVMDQLLDAEGVLGFVIEFHDVDLHEARISAFIEQAKGKFELVHIHPNNFGNIDQNGDPLVLEMSFVRADLAQLRPFDDALPLADLDAPNNPLIPDLNLAFQ